MRVTSSMYYDNLFGPSNSKLNKKLFDVNKQIASGLKIQYASDDVSTFVETMRLDNELTVLGQVKKSTQSASKVANQSDTVMNEFTDTLNRMRVLFINAANASSSEASQDAISGELKGLEEHLKNLANTSINGQYLFSGSAVDTRPIADDGTYQGNDKTLKAFLGSNVQQQYNIPGSELFLGEENKINREITSNVRNNSLTAEFPDFTNATVQGVENSVITTSSTIRDLMGDTDNTTGTNINHFYLRGVKHDGTAFATDIKMNQGDTVAELLKNIGDIYGNTLNTNVVNVNLNQFGQIVIEDKIKGSSKLDFNLTAAVDYDQTDVGDSADISDAIYGVNAGKIDNLKDGETNFKSIINGTSNAGNSNLFVKSFTQSPYTATTIYTPLAGKTLADDIYAIAYDRTQFTKEGSRLTSDVSQVLKLTNAFASPSTKLSEVADLSQGTAGTLDGTMLKLVGENINGVAYDVQIDLQNTAGGGSTFSLDGGITKYSIFDMSSTRVAVNADDMTYQQLMDVVNMVVTGQTPIANTTAEYDSKITSSKGAGNTILSYDGKITFEQLNTTDTKASISIFDDNSGDFTAPSSILSFNSNNALTIRDPKTDFFKSIHQMIQSVEEYKEYPDASTGNKRGVGIENAIQMMDDLFEHVSRSHAIVGAQSNALTRSSERAELLEISTMTLRSSIIDTDIAEASLTLTQLTLNYQAMLSTVGRVSQLSLVNYL